MEIIIILTLGLCIGSFLNVCIYRIANGKSIAFPASHCTSCGSKIKRRDLIPVLSYLIIGGKCRNCGEKISIRYPAIELLNGVLYVLLYCNYGFSINLLKGCILISLMIVIAFIDFDTHEVYSSTTIFGIISSVVFILVQWAFKEVVPWEYFLGGAIGFISIWLIVKLTGGMGEGDIDIALICGMFLGAKNIVLTLFLAFVIGGFVAIILLLSRKKGRKAEIAFGPYLALGAVISMIYGSGIIDFYFNMFL